MSETTVTVTIDPPSADISESDATVRLSPLSIGDQGQPRSQRTVHFDVPTSPASAISLDSKQYDSDSDAASIRDRAIKIVDYEEGEGSKISTRSGQQGGDPRLSELRPCVECKTLDIHCDGVPCTGCEERGVDCTPSRETFEDALAHVVVHLEARLLELNSLKRTLSSAIFLQQISEELGSNELFRFNFRLHKEKTQLVSYTRKCYYCHPEKLECARDQEDRRCPACIKENRICRRFAITFTNSDTRLGQVDTKFRALYKMLSGMKDEVKKGAKQVGAEADRGQPIRKSTDFVDTPEVGQNHASSVLATFPWMAIFDHAIPHPEDGDVKDLTQYTKRKGEHAAKDSGGFADIYEGTLKIESENTSLTVKVALKQLRGGKEVQEKIARRHHREMLIWSKLRHPNILPFLGSAQFGSAAPCFVSPWIAHGDVGAYIKSTPTADRVRIIRGMVQGITYLHTQPRPVVHGDIKGGNILISSDGTAILCDFGLSIMLDTESDPSTTTSAQNGSSRWMAPERLLPNNYGLTALSSRTLAADMFSFAMTSVEILTGDVPFGSNTPKLYAFLEVMKGTRPTIPEPYASESKYESLATAIRTCWREHREERLTAEEVLGLLG